MLELLGLMGVVIFVLFVLGVMWRGVRLVFSVIVGLACFVRTTPRAEIEFNAFETKCAYVINGGLVGAVASSATPYLAPLLGWEAPSFTPSLVLSLGVVIVGFVILYISVLRRV